jgi:hypothetical protein
VTSDKQARNCVCSTLLRCSQVLPASRKQPILPFDVQVSINAFQHEPRGYLPEFFGLDFVEAERTGIRDTGYGKRVSCRKLFPPGQRIAAAFKHKAVRPAL